MKIAVKALFLFLIYIVSQPVYGQADVLNEIMQAGNRRDIDEDHIILGLASRDSAMVNKTLVVVGNVGGSKAAEFITAKLSDTRPDVRRAAAFAAAIAGEVSLFDALKSAVAVEKDPHVAARMYHSMGYLAPETMRPYFGLELFRHDDGIIQRGILDGYMQAIVYAKVKAADLDYTNFNNILDIATRSGDEASAAAYFLGRVKELETVLAPTAVIQAVKQAKSAPARMQLVRVLAQLGGDNTAAIVPYLSHADRVIRLEAINGMGKARDPLQILALKAAGVSDFAVLRKAVIDVFTGSGDKDFLYQGKALMDIGLSDKSVWVQGASLRGVNLISQDAAQHLSEKWYDSSGSYRKGYAMEMLADREPFKTRIAALAEDNVNPYLRSKARAVLEMPELTYDTPAQPTVSYEEALLAGQSMITFETTKGTILVELSDETPYTAYNFVTLARAGVFDGMLFHRVIGNFVAQAGERITPLLEDWGPIRDEWTELTHEIGTVGLATSGKDTGRRQFFFNTAQNRHLNGRYTVFGKVIEGLNAMMRLEEGDKIITATVK